MSTGASGQLQASLIRDVSFANFDRVMGSDTAQALFTACTFNGWWECNNNRKGAFRMGGSDCTFWTDGMLLDSNPASYPGTGQTHLTFDYMDKTTVGPLYITCEAGWQGIRVNGPAYNQTAGTSNGGPLTFRGLRVEGRNQTQPSYGAIIRVTGGIVDLSSTWIGFGMSDPTNSTITATRPTTDAGIIHVTGGYVDLDRVTYGRASTVAETVPLVYATGGVVNVKRVAVSRNNGPWVGKPRVNNNGAEVDTDNSVTVI
jgi:hypothetical protein